MAAKALPQHKTDSEHKGYPVYDKNGNLVEVMIADNKEDSPYKNFPLRQPIKEGCVDEYVNDKGDTIRVYCKSGFVRVETVSAWIKGIKAHDPAYNCRAAVPRALVREEYLGGMPQSFWAGISPAMMAAATTRKPPKQYAVMQVTEHGELFLGVFDKLETVRLLYPLCKIYAKPRAAYFSKEKYHTHEHKINDVIVHPLK